METKTADDIQEKRIAGLLEAVEQYPPITLEYEKETYYGKVYVFDHIPVRIGNVTFDGLKLFVTFRLGATSAHLESKEQPLHPHAYNSRKLCSADNNRTIANRVHKGNFMAALAMTTMTFLTYSPGDALRSYVGIAKCDVCNEFGGSDGDIPATGNPGMYKCYYCSGYALHDACIVRQYRCDYCMGDDSWCCTNCATERKTVKIDGREYKFCTWCYKKYENYDRNCKFCTVCGTLRMFKACDCCGKLLCTSHDSMLSCSCSSCREGERTLTCEECTISLKSELYTSPILINKDHAPTGVKACTNKDCCHSLGRIRATILVPEMFHRDASKPDGLSSRCRVCRNMARRERYIKQQVIRFEERYNEI